MATKKAVGAVANGRDSNSRREGVKKFEGEFVNAGAILVRQQGNKFWPGVNAYQGSDFTLHAAVAGKVVFAQKRRKTYDGSLRRETYVSVEPVTA